MLARTERLSKPSFGTPSAEWGTVWEPPIDMIETAGQILIYVAIPGIAVEHVETAVENGVLTVSGMRQSPPELTSAIIHRLELPQGRFLRQIVLPVGQYRDVRQTYVNGHIVIAVQKGAP